MDLVPERRYQEEQALCLGPQVSNPVLLCPESGNKAESQGPASTPPVPVRGLWGVTRNCHPWTDGGPEAQRGAETGRGHAVPQGSPLQAPAKARQLY